MITFSPLRTPRLQIEMRELCARDAILLCQLPPDQNELGTTELIGRIVKSPESPRRGQVTDQRLWSVQERAFVVAHYMAHLIGGDFRIGDEGKYSDYLLSSGIGDPPPAIYVGDVNGEKWFLQPLLGWHAESIERLVVADELPAKRLGWLTGAMAAQLYTESGGALSVHDETDTVIDQAITDRADVLMGLAESDFMALVHIYYERIGDLDHTFKLSISDDGFAFAPAVEVPAGLPPARFHFSNAIREDTSAIFGGLEGEAD